MAYDEQLRRIEKEARWAALPAKAQAGGMVMAILCVVALVVVFSVIYLLGAVLGGF